MLRKKKKKKKKKNEIHEIKSQINIKVSPIIPTKKKNNDIDFIDNLDK